MVGRNKVTGVTYSSKALCAKTLGLENDRKLIADIVNFLNIDINI